MADGWWLMADGWWLRTGGQSFSLDPSVADILLAVSYIVIWSLLYTTCAYTYSGVKDVPHNAVVSHEPPLVAMPWD
jgi:hypothetical protein